MFALLATTLWLLLCWTLSAHWLTNQQYSFGLLVPPLALFLFWKRWHTRPAPGPPPPAARLLLILFAAAFSPLWLVAQPNPEWRLLGWTLSLTVSGFLIAGLLAAGGRPWARHFAFPILFTLSAVPWPSALEIPVVLGLMRIVAGISADILNLFGIAAVAAGSVMELKNGTLGVDEACSGVRSLQASLMAALFLGELYRLRLARRFVLVGTALAVAFVCNVGRAVFLATQVASQGMDAVARYHDPAGFTILTICFILVWLVALLIARNQQPPQEAEPSLPALAIPGRLTGSLAAWLAVTLGTVEWWYRHDAPATRPSWVFAMPVKREGFLSRDLPQDTRDQMLPDHAETGAWEGAGGRWLAFYFRWYAGTGRARILAIRHKPEGCLPATGWSIVEERPAIEIAFEGLSIPFRALTFARGAERAHVYFCIWQETADGRQSPPTEDPRKESLRLVAQRERALGQQIVELILVGPLDGTAADAAFRKEIEPLLVKKGL